MQGVLGNAPPVYPGQARAPKQTRAENLRRIVETFENPGIVLLRNPLSLTASLNAMEPRPRGNYRGRGLRRCRRSA